jgi:hypothetical protein
MARQIRRHSTRLSQVHEGALDSAFAQGQRVMTIDGLAGRVLFVSASFSPGITEYEVVLDGGMGQGVYTASQLRAVPADLRTAPPGNHLPAGVTASFEAEAEAHLASEDYPEMGTVLHDRPDPGAQFSVIGGLCKTAAATYGRPDDVRDDEYNGGEPDDTGMYWAEPGQQPWAEEHLGPQEPAPPPPWAMSPAMAHLAQIEEACQLFGGTLHRATTINGTQIDDHGDAPEHGTVPRASAPDSYDGQSTEGDGDPKWSNPVDPADRKLYNGATVGMYPEAMSAGGGPGLAIGPFTAREIQQGDDLQLADTEAPDALWHEAARVPWTGHERNELHNWADVPTGTDGDFVPSTDFTGLHSINVPAVPPKEVAREELRATAARHSESARHALLAQLEEDYPPEALTWLHHAAITGPHYVPLRSIDWADRHTWTSYKQPERVGGFLDTMEKKAARGEPLKPALVVATPGRKFIGDGHHRGLAQLLAATSGGGPMGVWAYTAAVGRTQGPWDDMHAQQIHAPSKNEDSTKSVEGADAPPEQVEDFQGQVDEAVGALGQDAHDDPDNSLDNSPDNAGQPQVSSGAAPDNPGSVRKRPGVSSTPLDTGVDTEWPMAGAQVNETGPARTQGRNDGKVKRAHLGAFEAAVADLRFRWEFTASWSDVVAKAKRIRAEGHVRITHASPGMVIGEVRGDHDIYESGIQRPPGKPATIQHWACGCPWASFHQASIGARYSGRPCSHVMALQFEAQSQGMFGRRVVPDEAMPSWGRTDVTVRSWPPYEGDPHKGRWAETWLAPAASLHHATPDEARDWDWTPEERDEWERAPVRHATAALLAAGEELADLVALAQLGGFTIRADQANAPWGSENVSHHPPVKPYGATEPPNKDQDPGSYGFLAAPDPDNWGGIQEDSYVQMPLSTTEGARKVLVPGAGTPLPADLNYPDIGNFQQEDQETFGFSDRAPAAGPSTSITPRDPQGIRMEETLHQGAGIPSWIKQNRQAEDKCTRCGAPGETINADTSELMCWNCHQKHLERTYPELHGPQAELHEQPEPALPSTTGDDLETTASIVQDRSGSYESVRELFRRTTGGTPMGDLSRETFPQAQYPSVATQEPGMGSMDEYLSPEDPSIQTIGGMFSIPDLRATAEQQWSGAGSDSDEVTVEPGQPQGSLEDIVASFQRSAAASQYSEGAGSGSRGGAGISDGDIAAQARAFLTPQWSPAPPGSSLQKTADVLPDAEAAELISEGRGQRARNLGLLRLEGTHYEGEEEDLARRGVSLDDYDDDVLSV